MHIVPEMRFISRRVSADAQLSADSLRAAELPASRQQQRSADARRTTNRTHHSTYEADSMPRSNPGPQQARPAIRIVVGSTNPAKLEPVRMATRLLFRGSEVVSASVASGVADQPLSEEETLTGALNRARNALMAASGDYGVGIEGGIANVGGIWFGVTRVAVVDREGRTGLASAARFQLPDAVADQVRAGRELSAVVEDLTGIRGIAKKGGAMGWLTNGQVTWRDATLQAVHFAFATVMRDATF
jgi:inosine/xanthosine triphosphatase